MAERLIELDVRARAAWRKWLAEHHAASPGVWLVRHKQHTRVAAMSHAELVDEALCFGWVDSLIKRLDDDRFAVKVTPRKPSSKWSDKNRKRWKELRAAGRLALPGVAAAPTVNRYAARPRVPQLPGYVAQAIRANAKAWRFFQSLAPTYRRDFVVWIHVAKRPETRAKRLRESIALLAAGEKLGLK